MESKKNKSRKGKHRLNDRAEDPKGGAGKFKKPKNGHNFKTNTSGEGKKKFCLRHGLNSTHVTDECKVLKAEADKLKRQHDAGSKESRYNKSKEYKKHSNEKDLNTFYEERFKELEGELKKQQKLSSYLQKKLKAAPKEDKKDSDSESTSSEE